MTTTPSEQFERSLTLFDAIGIAICAMIGSGIFIVSSQMASELQSGLLLLLAWGLSGVVTLIGALAYGELAAIWPNVGGQYVYIKEIWGKFTAFLYGWALSFVIKTGSIAAVAIGFSKFASVFIPNLNASQTLLDIAGIIVTPQKLMAVALIVVLSLLNSRGLQGTIRLQNVVTVTNILALSLIILSGFLFGFHPDVLLENLSTPVLPTIDVSFLTTLGVALIGPLFALDGWNGVTFVASEMKRPEKNLPLALLIGVGLTVLLYILVNVVYLSALPLTAIMASKNGVVGVALMQQLLGQPGALLIAGIIMVAALGCVNSMVLSGSRALYTLAKDLPILKQAAVLGEKSHVPENAIYIQAAWAIVLVFSRSFFELLDYMVFAQLLFYALTVSGLFLIRRKKITPETSYKTWGYPYLPLLFVVFCVWILVSLLIAKPMSAIMSLLVIVSGSPLYYVTHRGAMNKATLPAA